MSTPSNEGEFVKIWRAQDEGIARLITALEADYEAILADEMEALGYTTGSSPWVYAPPVESWVVTVPELLEAQLRNHYVVGLIYPSGPHTIGKHRSGGRGYNGAEATFDVTVVVACQVAPTPADLLDRHGNPTTGEAALVARAQAHKAAITRSIYLYARDTSASAIKCVYDLQLRENHQFARWASERQRVGIAYTNWRIHQRVALPERLHLP